MKRIAFLMLALAILLVSCGGDAELDLPSPSELYAAIDTAVELPDMIDVADDYIESNIGITAEEYEEAVYYILAFGASCDAVVIIEAKDETSADICYEKLEGWYDYIKRSSSNYLTEYQPMIEDAMLRRDGLTLSLVISDKVDEIKAVYDSYK